MVLPKLYAISLMYTLNLRNKLRSERMTSHERSTGTNPNHLGKRSFVPNDLAYRSGGATIVSNAGSPGQMERGVSFVGGRGRGYSGGHTTSRGRLDGIHVETHISTHGGSSGGGVEVSIYTSGRLACD
jgi:hypothetical protein